MSKKYSKSGVEKTSYASVLSTSYDELGEKVEVPGLFSVAVVNVQDKLAVLNLVSRKFEGDGTILSDISKELIDIKRLEIRGKAYGISLTIEAVEA